MNRRGFLKSIGLAALAIAGGVGLPLPSATGRYRLWSYAPRDVSGTERYATLFSDTYRCVNTYNSRRVFGREPRTLFLKGVSWEMKYCGKDCLPYYEFVYDVEERPFSQYAATDWGCIGEAVKV